MDRAFEIHFPTFLYARFGSQIFVPIFRGGSKDFSVPNFLNLLNELDLVGGVMCILPGGSPVDFFGGLVFLNKEGEIQEKDAFF